MSDVVLWIDDCYKCCRICHELDLESCNTLESPCHFSGTLKFAHRDCTQRWCDEKGNTTCEICLQISVLHSIFHLFKENLSIYYTARECVCVFASRYKLRKTKKFKPGYTAPAKKPQLIHTAATISLFGAINEPGTETREEILENDCTRCISAVEISAACRRSLAFVFTILLLMKNLFDILSGGTQGYPFSLMTVLIVKTMGIMVPMCILFRITSVICNSINHQQYYQNPDSYLVSSSNKDNQDYEDIDGDDNV